METVLFLTFLRVSLKHPDKSGADEIDGSHQPCPLAMLATADENCSP